MTTPPTGAPLAAPFPWFGGKRRAAGIVWRRLGDPSGYVEPFAGSAAVLLARPPFRGRRVGVAAARPAGARRLGAAVLGRPAEAAGPRDQAGVMSRKPRPRDATIVRCPAGCGGWIHVRVKTCPYCGVTW